MSKTVIKVENLSKAYQIGQIGTGTVSRDLERWWMTRVRGKDDPFLKIGEENDRTSKGNSNIVWSLNDITFDIMQGETVGIIGKNGAGKSTLLKILSRVTSPTSGNIKMKGRIASLLEVGTGFHPELSGRENVYLNGAILGMRRSEINDKLDEIIQFSGVERYIDTPVKRYSSGMYVRLAFAVAAHLESEILIVDEVLAVGDAEFQKKCLGKMGEVSKKDGRTILFVSHNMAAVKSLCGMGMLLVNGRLTNFGKSDEIISSYYESIKSGKNNLDSTISKKSEFNLGKGKFTRVWLCNSIHNKTSELEFLEPGLVYFVFDALEDISNVMVSVIILDQYGGAVLMGCPGPAYKPVDIKKGTTTFSFMIRENLMPGKYYISLGLSFFTSGQSLDWNTEVYSFDVTMQNTFENVEYPWHTIHGTVKPQSNVEIISHEH
jgi:lipopolysaccharide transport system ATP-binding protein